MSAKLREITKRPRAWLDANCHPWPGGLYVDAQGFLYQEGSWEMSDIGEMSDIAEKLRQAYHNDLTDVPILLDGADEIDRLRERVVKLERSQLETSIENNRLREALTKIRDLPEDADRTMREIARAAIDNRLHKPWGLKA